MKRIAALMLCFAAALGLTACTGGDDQAAPTGKKTEKVVLKFATQHPTEHMAQKSAERIKARIEKETDGRIEVKIYPANQLGDASQL